MPFTRLNREVMFYWGRVRMFEEIHISKLHPTVSGDQIFKD